MALNESYETFLRDRVMWVAVASGVALVAAFPPLGCWPMAFLAPCGWIRLVCRQELKTRRPLLGLYVAGFVHWLLLIQWVRLPHWSAYFGWIALTAYLAIYVPAFVLGSRVLVHRWRMPAVVVAPVVWTGLELARGYLFTGFSISLLGHSLVDTPILIQIASLFGGYGVSFVIVTVAVGIERLAVSDGNRSVYSALYSLGLLLATVVYGYTPNLADGKEGSEISVALIQGVYDTRFGPDTDRYSAKAFQDYLRLSQEAIGGNEIDLIVWPESMFSCGDKNFATSYTTFEEPLTARPQYDLTADQLEAVLKIMAERNQTKINYVAAQLGANLLVGTARQHSAGDQDFRFNSVAYINRNGETIGMYDKQHPVMFGEYVPLGETFPWLYRLTPNENGLTAGRSPRCFDIGGVLVAPSICFENTVPHLIRKQTNALAEDGQDPDCLITVTNDGWFWGSSLLDVHLACGIFRAVEMRRPVLIAANTGFSAVVDSTGTVQQKAGRRKSGFLIARVQESSGFVSAYRRFGDLPALACLIVTVAGMIHGLVFWFGNPGTSD